MAAAAIPIRMAMLLPFLAVALLSQASANEPVAVETALESDDQCAAGDAACALNALQRRGAALAQDAEEPSLLSESVEETKSAARRRRSPHVPDLSPQGEKKLKKEVTKIAGNIKKLQQELVDLEENVNMTYRMVNGGAPGKGRGGGGSGGSRSGGSDDDDSEEDGDERYGDGDVPTWLEADSEVSSTSLRRRRNKPPPRMTAVQHMVDKCQAVMNKFWTRTTRLDRLIEWCKTKIQNPGTPDWEEPDDLEDDDDDDDDDEKKKNGKKGKDEDEESLLEVEEGSSSRRRGVVSAKENNPQDANMQKIVDDLAREVEGAEKELARIKTNADGARKMALENLPDDA